MSLEMDVPVNFLCLPDEIIVNIYKSNILSITDVCNMTQACVRLSQIGKEDVIWKWKFKQRWPVSWNLVHETLLTSTAFDNKSWMNECTNYFSLKFKTTKFLKSLSPILYGKSHITAKIYKKVEHMMNASNCNAYYMYEIIINIIKKDMSIYARKEFDYLPHLKYNRNSIKNKNRHGVLLSLLPYSDKNLTVKYYAEKILLQVHYEIIRRQFQHFTNLRLEEQTYELGMYLLGQAISPFHRFDYHKFQKRLDNITTSVLDILERNFPDHSLHKSKYLLFNKTTLACNQWNNIETEQIIRTVSYFIFEQSNFYTEDNTCNLLDFSIYDVASHMKGTWFTSAVLHIAICRRLGVILEPLANEKIISRGAGKTDPYFCVKLGNKGDIEKVQEKYPTVLSVSKFLILTTTQIMHNNLIQDLPRSRLFCIISEIRVIIDPYDIQTNASVICTRNYDDANYNHILKAYKRSIQLVHGHPNYQNMKEFKKKVCRENREEPKAIFPKHRSPHCESVRYPVGCLFRHKLYNYYCVTVGWDEFCRMSPGWIQTMQINRLEYQAAQSFYNVLAHDGSYRYVAQENLIVDQDPKPIPNDQIGRYFKGFNGKCYLPNDELKAEYPDDQPIRLKFVRDLLPDHIVYANK